MNASQFSSDLQDEFETEDQEETLNRPPVMGTDTESMDEDSHLSRSSNSLKGRKHPFFQRADSTLFIGCPQPDPFTTPLAEALPLADKPHLLQPNSRKEDLFGFVRQPVTIPPQPHEHSGAGCLPLEVLPTRLGLSMRSVSVQGHPPNHVPSSYSSTFSEPPPLVSIVPQAGASAEHASKPSTTRESSEAETLTKPASKAPKDSAAKDNPTVDNAAGRAPIIVSTKTQKSSVPIKTVIVMARSATPVITHPSVQESPATTNEGSKMDTTPATLPPATTKAAPPKHTHAVDEGAPSIPTLSTDAAASNDNVSANVTVETSNNYAADASQMPPRPQNVIGQLVSHDILLGLYYSPNCCT